MSELLEQESEIGVKVRLDGSPYLRQLGVIVSVDLTKIQEKDSSNNTKKDEKDAKLDLNNSKTTDKSETPQILTLSFEIQPHHTQYPRKSMRVYALDDVKKYKKELKKEGNFLLCIDLILFFGEINLSSRVLMMGEIT